MKVTVDTTQSEVQKALFAELRRRKLPVKNITVKIRHREVGDRNDSVTYISVYLSDSDKFYFWRDRRLEAAMHKLFGYKHDGGHGTGMGSEDWGFCWER